jgi:uncharacterized protein (DUF433 family)
LAIVSVLPPPKGGETVSYQGNKQAALLQGANPTSLAFSNSLVDSCATRRCSAVRPELEFTLETEIMNRQIEIVDRGRGLQLSTSRVTVQDLVPYFQEGCSYEEIIRCIPTLTHEEIALVNRYYQDHKEGLDEEDRQIRERSERRKNPAWIEKVLDEACAERLATMERLRQQQGNGAPK